MTAWTILMEARFSLLAAIIAGFGRAVSEVGSAMMLGGNIRFYTRTMTTAIALETSKGEFGFGLALGFFLLLVVFSINILFHFLQVKDRQ
jgi:tungstate transport system permease protein